jgi:hypothetical protein
VAATGGRATAGEVWTWVSTTVLASVVVPVLSPHYRVELSDNFLVVRGSGHRDIAWRDIIGLEVRKTAGVRTVVVHVSDGRRIPLRAPISLLDRRFDDKAQVLVDWWTARRVALTACSGRTGRDTPPCAAIEVMQRGLAPATLTGVDTRGCSHCRTCDGCQDCGQCAGPGCTCTCTCTCDDN